MYFRKQDLDDLMAQRAVKAGTYDFYLANKNIHEAARDRLKKKFGRDPLPSDVAWAVLIDRSIDELRRGQVLSYSVTRRLMGRQLNDEGKPLQAISLFLEAAILDLNGARNMEPQGTGQLPTSPYTLDNAVSPLDAFLLGQYVKDLVLTPVQLLKEFEKVWRRVPARSRLPLTRDETWRRLVEAIRGPQ